MVCWLFKSHPRGLPISGVLCLTVISKLHLHSDIGGSNEVGFIILRGITDDELGPPHRDIGGLDAGLGWAYNSEGDHRRRIGSIATVSILLR